jgi:putative protease
MGDNIIRPELLSPAGDRSSLETALEAGADAVYFGVSGLNMREAASNFQVQQISDIMSIVKRNGARGYLALNISVYDNELPKVLRILDEAARSGVDAVILWDMAVLSAARERGLEIHISTQAGISNFESLRMYAELGAKRAVLARELSLDRIIGIKNKIRENDLDLSIETFIHGAMCVSVSGRCFLSGYTFASGANRGRCYQPCRREYTITDMEDGFEYVIGRDYVLSPRDLCTIEFIDILIEQGIDSFKIEGRMRSPDYVGTVTRVYRTAVDAYYEGRLDDRLKAELKEQLRNVFNRGFDTGFYFGLPEAGGSVPSSVYIKEYLGEVRKYYPKISVAEISLQTGGISTGDSLLIYGDRTPVVEFDAESIQIDHAPVDKAQKGDNVAVKVPRRVRKADKVFCLKSRY